MFGSIDDRMRTDRLLGGLSMVAGPHDRWPDHSYGGYQATPPRATTGYIGFGQPSGLSRGNPTPQRITSILQRPGSRPEVEDHAEELINRRLKEKAKTTQFERTRSGPIMAPMKPQSMPLVSRSASTSRVQPNFTPNVDMDFDSRRRYEERVKREREAREAAIQAKIARQNQEDERRRESLLREAEQRRREMESRARFQNEERQFYGSIGYSQPIAGYGYGNGGVRQEMMDVDPYPPNQQHQLASKAAHNLPNKVFNEPMYSNQPALNKRPTDPYYYQATAGRQLYNPPPPPSKPTPRNLPVRNNMGNSSGNNNVRRLPQPPVANARARATVASNARVAPSTSAVTSRPAPSSNVAQARLIVQKAKQQALERQRQQAQQTNMKQMAVQRPLRQPAIRPQQLANKPVASAPINKTSPNKRTAPSALEMTPAELKRARSESLSEVEKWIRENLEELPVVTLVMDGIGRYLDQFGIPPAVRNGDRSLFWVEISRLMASEDDLTPLTPSRIEQLFFKYTNFYLKVLAAATSHEHAHRLWSCFPLVHEFIMTEEFLFSVVASRPRAERLLVAHQEFETIHQEYKKAAVGPASKEKKVLTAPKRGIIAPSIRPRVPVRNVLRRRQAAY